MSNLPKDRITPSYPFEHSGVDFAGPIKLRIAKSRGKGTMKAYICIFVCLSTKAVHIELVEDYSTEAFIGAFDRFTGRRGHCDTLCSDQGTNFVGANAEITRRFTKASAEFKELSSLLSKRKTKWVFNPPAAPHFGGIWEAAIKSAKFHMKRIIGEHVLNFIELCTLLRIEACLNSRPLIPLPDSDSEFEMLTLPHLLIHRPSYILPEPTRSNNTLSYKQRWLWITEKAQLFWKAWTNDYLRSMQERQKWQQPTRQFKVGDIVLMRNSTTPPAIWPLAIITEVKPGPDGIVRVVKIKTATSTYTRPVVELVLLVRAKRQDEEALEELKSCT